MEKEKILIVYYSNSGTAEKIARHIQKLLPAADMDRIGYQGKMNKRYSMFAALFKVFGAPQEIEGGTHAPADYGRLILVCPIWAGMPAPVMRAYFRKHRDVLKDKKYNLVCVSGGGEDRAMKWLNNEKLPAPVEKLSLKQKRVEAGDYNLTGII